MQSGVWQGKQEDSNKAKENCELMASEAEKTLQAGSKKRVEQASFWTTQLS